MSSIENIKLVDYAVKVLMTELDFGKITQEYYKEQCCLLATYNSETLEYWKNQVDNNKLDPEWYERSEYKNGYTIDMRMSRPRMYFAISKGGKTLHTSRAYSEYSLQALTNLLIAEFNVNYEYL